MPKSPHHYPVGQSQLKASQDYMERPIRQALQKAAAHGRDTARLLVGIKIYEPPPEKGKSGTYAAWPGMRWKHDVGTPEQAQHFVETLDRFVALYQQSPQSLQVLLGAQDFGDEAADLAAPREGA